MPTVPQPPVATTGVYTSSQISALVAAVNFALNPPTAELRQVAVQAIANSTYTSLAFDAFDVDKNPSGTPGHSNSVNNTRYTAQYTGWHLVGGAVEFALNTTGQRGLRWTVNGISINASDVFVQATTGGQVAVPARAKRIFLNVNDYLELQCFQNSGGSLNTASVNEAGSSMAVGWVSN